MSNKNVDTLLSTSQLVIGYRDGRRENILLKDLNLTLLAGELVCFMGVNGVGKSSLIRSLAGLQKPLSGDIFYAGKKNQGDLPKALSVVLTDKIAAPTMTSYELIAFGRYPYLGWNILLNDDDKQIIEQCIDLVNIRHLRDEKFHELSDGQQQLVLIARALAQHTDIILLDEPTAHLDLQNKIEIMNLLRRISRQEKKGILIATHELDLALQTADVVWLAGKEKNIVAGIPEDLVLNGSFDEVFQFKGYNLKTGRIEHGFIHEIEIHVTGEGDLYHWTKIALERAGYRITANNSTYSIVAEAGEKPSWIVHTSAREIRVNTLQEVLKIIAK